MKKAFFEDSAMAKLIVESIYHGMEENDGLWKLEVCCGI